MDSPSVRFVSDCFVQPRHTTEDSIKPIYLAPWDIVKLSVHYIQKGLLYTKPRNPNRQLDGFMESFLDKLKASLSVALVHFYPLAGRLRTIRNDDPHLYTVCIDCADSPGARFIYTTLDMTVSDILDPVYVPRVVESFFDHNGNLNHDGHDRPLVSIQVTELVDGVFIGCSFNHAVADGASYWNFLNSWSEIFLAQEKGFNYDSAISHPQLLDRYFPEGSGIPVNLPFRDPSEFVVPFEPPPFLKERVFRFSAGTIARLKARVNEECGTKVKANEVSSFKALAALVWVSITRARRYHPSQATSFRMAANNRARMRPSLPPDYFGNCVSPTRALATSGEILSAGLGALAWRLHVAVAEHTAETIDDWHREWLLNPNVPNLRHFDPFGITISSSPRFNKYGVEFGLGKAVALRSGRANKVDGKVTAYPGREGGGSIDLVICLSPETMAALEADAEFMAAVED